MQFYKISIIIFSITTLISSCSDSNDNNNDDDDNTVITNDNNSCNNSLSQVNSFIYRGLNLVYLYKDSQPLLNNNRFNNLEDQKKFTDCAGSPRSLFDQLTVEKDRFSWIVDDFNELEKQFQGANLDNGMDFNLSLISDNSDAIFGIVTQVTKGSNAESQGIKRGDFFTQINGTPLNRANFSDLLNNVNYDLGIASFNNNSFSVIKTVPLSKTEFLKNPIGKATVLDIDNEKIGYLLYNSFIRNSEEALNLEFNNFKEQGITNLILDLRYNGGGSVATAIALSGMITGGFNNQILAKQQWNSELQDRFLKENSEDLNIRFSNKTQKSETALNSLNLNTLYVITSKRRTASASEFIINSLRPYINVVVIGDSNGTVGKSQASITIFDSPSLGKDNELNTSHTYAMQPLVYSIVNKNNIGVPTTGILPDISIKEDLFNLGILGDANEPLLKAAINAIKGVSGPVAKNISTFPKGDYIGNNEMQSPIYQQMYE